MLMQFVGKNSLGFERGKIYECTIKKTKKWLELTTTNGLKCPYSSEKALGNNWKVVN